MRRTLWICLLLFSLLIAGLRATPASAQITIADARQQGDGATVVVEGVVTRAFGDFVRFQDTSGATGASGLVVRQTSGAFYTDVQDGTITQGTEIQIEGTLSTFNGLLQINEGDLASYTVLGQTSVPAPQSVSLSDLSQNGEDYESELVTIADLELVDDITTFGSDVTYEVVEQGQSTSFDLRIQGSDESEVSGTPAPSTAFVYTGIVGQFDSNNSTTTGYQLIPVLRSDIDSGVFFTFSRSYNVSLESDGTVSATVQAVNVQDGQTVSVDVGPSGDGTADASTDLSSAISPSSLTFTGPDPAPQTVSLSINADGTTEGVEYLLLELTSSDGPGLGTFTQWILDDATAQGPVEPGVEGSDLLTSLSSTYGDPATIGYTAARDTMYRVIYNENGIVQGFYTGFDVAVDPDGGDASNQALNGGINTEHIFPQSLGAGDEPARSNMHILVPARDVVNTARSNYPFADIPDADTDRWFFEDQSQTTTPTTNVDAWSELNDSPSDRDLHRFEPRESVKGDVARAILYFVTAYPNRANLDFFRIQKETLLQWHADDPVDATEMRRNVLQASYQENKLNPFVVDPTLADRAFGVIGAPTDIVAAPGSDNVQLRWREPLSGTVEGYNVYRASSAFAAPENAQKVNTSGLVTATSFTDTDVQVGGTYVYRITAVDGQGNESGLSGSADAVVYPSALSVSIDKAFGDLSQSSSYRLVALPGDVDAEVGANLGDPATDWTALWDDGSDNDYMLRFDGSDTFRFRPGRGFWLLSSSNWTVSTDLPTLSLSNDAVTIPLHDGWNIISNPLPVDLVWADVSAANGGSLQPVWSWNGSFQSASTFGSAQDGEAFYFLNDGGLSELVLPLSAADLSGTSTSTNALVGSQTGLTVEAASGDFTSRVTVGQRPGARDGRDRFDVIAPPSGFAGLALRIASTTESARQRFFARDVRPPSDDGERYNLTLDAPANGPVTFRATGAEDGTDQNAVLVNLASGKRYELTDGPIQVDPPSSSSTFRLLVGSKAFTAGPKETDGEIVIEKPAPNPFRDQTTLSYTLPEAQNVTVRVFDLLGRRIRTLVDGRQSSGPHTVRWTGTNASGSPISSGMYFVQVTVGERQVVHKVVHVR